MISIVELFGFISIAVAVSAIKIALKYRNKREETPNWELSHCDGETEPFLEIPMQLLEKRLRDNNNGGINELKRKIENFKDRNRFYL